MVILTDCDLFERLCPGQIGMLTHRFVTIYRSLYHVEILADLISAEHSENLVTSRSPTMHGPESGVLVR